ncbi:ankyrin repeat domain-containing protein [Endozoicomonas sp. ALB091]|uniref:ankyrin repeat domain-containing protein n=1 Tax=Endozoicomonas sp. ALB091 TaxID=3403073 RepID=UPI003BB600BB
MFYLGVLITTVADTISSALATNPQNPTPSAANGDTPELRGDLDHREVYRKSSATKSICNPPSDSPSLSGQSLGQRTMWPLHVDITITDTPSSEENGHDAAASGPAELVVAIDEVNAAIDTARLPEETPGAVDQGSTELHEETPETVDQDSTELHEETPEAVDQGSTELHEETPEAADQDSTELHEETPEAADQDSTELHEETPEAADQDFAEVHEETPGAVDQDSTELHEETPEAVGQGSTELQEETPEAVGQDSTELPEEAAAEESFELRTITPEDVAINNTSGLPGETAVIDDTNEPPVSNSDITSLFGTNHEDTGAMPSNDRWVRYDTGTDTDPDTTTLSLIPSAPPPDYETLYPLDALFEAANNFAPSEANGMNKNPIPDYPEGACEWPPVTEKPISPEEFNDAYYEALATGNLNAIEHLRRDYPQRMIDPLQYPESRKYLYHPLHIAAAKNQMASLEFLCQLPCIDINAPSPEKNTALHLAIDHNNVAVVKFLCQRHDINVNRKNKSGFTPIMLACSKNADAQIIDALLNTQPVLDEEKQIETALSFSVKNNNLETTKKLLESGAKVDQKHNDGKNSIFYISFTEAADEISILLLDSLEDVNQPISINNARVLHLAAFTGKTKIAVYLIETLNASRFVTNKGKSMPVHYAAFGNNATTFRTLIYLGCNMYEEKGKIERDFWEMVKTRLAGYQIDRNKYGDKGYTLFREGGTPSEFFRGDIYQMINHQKKCGHTKESIKAAKESDRKKALIIEQNIKQKKELEKKKIDKKRKSEILKQKIRILEENNKKTTDNDAATGITLSTPSTPEQPAPDSDLSALAYTHQSGNLAMHSELTCYDVNDRRFPPGFTNMDDVPGTSAMPAMMEKQLDDKEFQNMYLNAIQAGDIDTLKYLKQVRPDLMIDSLVDPKDRNAFIHPLHLAASNKQWVALKFLCALDGININTRMSNGETVLNLAVCEKMEETILFLCQQPLINVNLSDYATRNTPIISACELNLSDQVIEALLAHKPSLKPNNYQKTALGFSVRNRNITVTKMLLEAGADVGKVEEDGKDSVFYIAFQDDNEEMSKLLVSYLPDIDQAVTKKDARVLHLASLLGKRTLIRHLIEDCEASRFLENKDHAMPVHYAAHHDHSQALYVLIELGCSLNERPGKIEDDFWRKKNNGFYSFLAGHVPPTVDFKSYNKPNACHLYYHGGTPSEIYGMFDITQLENFEKSLNIDINKEKNKDKARMEERQKQHKQYIEEKQKQKRNEQKQIKQEEKEASKEKKQLKKLKKELNKLNLEGEKLKEKGVKLETELHSPEGGKKINPFIRILRKI